MFGKSGRFQEIKNDIPPVGSYDPIYPTDISTGKTPLKTPLKTPSKNKKKVSFLETSQFEKNLISSLKQEKSGLISEVRQSRQFITQLIEFLNGLNELIQQKLANIFEKIIRTENALELLKKIKLLQTKKMNKLFEQLAIYKNNEKEHFAEMSKLKEECQSARQCLLEAAFSNSNSRYAKLVEENAELTEVLFQREMNCALKTKENYKLKKACNILRKKNK